MNSRPFGDQLHALRGGLVVSCQARTGEPFDAPHLIAEMARAATLGGAVGLRVDGYANIRAVRRVSPLPIIGIAKIGDRSGVYITPSMRQARGIVGAGAQIVALDATDRPRPYGQTLAELIRFTRDELQRAVMADISTLEEGIAAARANADLIATTLAGTTPYSSQLAGPDLHLVRDLVRAVDVPVVAEGRISNPEEVAACFDAGAFTVVVGRAITMPHEITRRFSARTPRAAQTTM
jgi:putative N-acetylmannosamine-6-phosphate epimerase